MTRMMMMMKKKKKKKKKIMLLLLLLLPPPQIFWQNGISAVALACEWPLADRMQMTDASPVPVKMMMMTTMIKMTFGIMASLQWHDSV